MGTNITCLLSHLLTCSPGLLVTWSLGQLVSWSQGHFWSTCQQPVSSSPGLAWSTGQLVTWSLSLLVNWSPGHVFTWSPCQLKPAGHPVSSTHHLPSPGHGRLSGAHSQNTANNLCRAPPPGFAQLKAIAIAQITLHLHNDVAPRGEPTRTSTGERRRA